jgi:hypothetical protein
MDNEGPDQLILEQMHETRAALADKLEALERKGIPGPSSAAPWRLVTLPSVSSPVVRVRNRQMDPFYRTPPV